GGAWVFGGEWGGFELWSRRAAGNAGRDARGLAQAARPRRALAYPAALPSEGCAVAAAVRACVAAGGCAPHCPDLVDIARQFDREAYRNAGRGRCSGHRSPYRAALSLS